MRNSIIRALPITCMLTLLTFGTALADGKTRCELCGMKWEQSVTRISATFKGDSKAHYYESIGCLYQSTSRDKLASVKMLDYSTVGGKQKMIDALSAHFLYRTERLSHSMAPFTAAFASKQAALDAQEQIGGDYMNFEQVWKKLGEHFKKKGGA